MAEYEIKMPWEDIGTFGKGIGNIWDQSRLFDSSGGYKEPFAPINGADATNDWNTIGGWGQLAGIAAGGAKTILGFQQLGEYQRQFDLMTAFKNRDLKNQAKLTNASLEGRQRALIGGTGFAGDVHGKYNTVAQQMSQYGVDGSKIS